ncbi:type IV pilus modification protein PilV [Salinisphaera orenii]|uniref:Pilus modification protein PilV n=1 Tax=Salinisphaera orenii YIM 95161 TaxID=1051139 RepID=A0A423PIU9_9GAMM|nr:type IV pilus modification protein PilV [Salinisphaera halophila]ROO25510.1 pilus modification protein PilV [Salinisphaera halophila YIM 95161]
MTPAHQPIRSASAGFTLLEALVAVVVISIGLLGLLGLQTVAVVNTQTSLHRTFASIGVDDISDRIRANAAGAAAGDYDTIAPTAAQPADCSDSACAPGEMAALDAWEWNRSLQQTLPSGKGFVDCAEPSTPTAADPCSVYTVTIGWSERAADTSGQQTDNLAQCDSDAHPSLQQCFVTQIQP